MKRIGYEEEEEEEEEEEKLNILKTINAFLDEIKSIFHILF